jgi:hypothetical protein
MHITRTFMLLAFMLLAAAALVFPCVAFAEEDSDDELYGPDQGDWELTLGASGSSDNEFGAGGFSLGGSFGYFLTEGFEIGVRQDMTYFDADDVGASFAGTTRAFLDYNIDFDRFRPYLGVNLGGRYGNSHVDETGTFAPEWGLKFYALEKTFVVASMEYQWFFEEVDDFDNHADNGQFVYGLGLGFNF